MYAHILQFIIELHTQCVHTFYSLIELVHTQCVHTFYKVSKKLGSNESVRSRTLHLGPSWN